MALEQFYNPRDTYSEKGRARLVPSKSEFVSLAEKYLQGLPLTKEESKRLERGIGEGHAGIFEGRPEYENILDRYQARGGRQRAEEAVLRGTREREAAPPIDREKFEELYREASEADKRILLRSREDRQRTQESLRNIQETGRKDALRREEEYKQALERSYGIGQERLSDQRLRFEDFARQSRASQLARRGRGLRQLGDFRRRQEDALGRWRSVYGREMADLHRIGDEQQLLMEEVTNAPSSVEQQARQNYDRQLQQASAMAAMAGRGVSGQAQALRDQSQAMNARIFGETAGLRSQEYLQRLGMRSGMLDAQRDLSQRRSQLGLSDADINRQQGLDALTAYNTVQNQLNQEFEESRRIVDAGRLMTQQDISFEADILNQRRAAWSQSSEIMNRLRQEQYAVEEFGSTQREREVDRELNLLNYRRGIAQDLSGIQQTDIQNQFATDRFNRQGNLQRGSFFQEEANRIAQENAIKDAQERARKQAILQTGVGLLSEGVGTALGVPGLGSTVTGA